MNDFGCEQIVREGKKKRARQLLGFSQGGVFARAMVEFAEIKQTEETDHFRAPHAGVWKFPDAMGWLARDENGANIRERWRVKRRAQKKSKSVQELFRNVSDKERFETYERSGSLLSVINGEGFLAAGILLRGKEK